LYADRITDSMKKAWAKRNVGEEIKQLDQHHGIITPRASSNASRT
jgi:excinuclease UvrABC helicase subunit UvrB